MGRIGKRLVPCLVLVLAGANSGWSEGRDGGMEGAGCRSCIVKADVPEELARAVVAVYEDEMETGRELWRDGKRVLALEAFWRARQVAATYQIDDEGAVGFDVASRLEGLAARGERRELLEIVADAPPERPYVEYALELARSLGR